MWRILCTIAVAVFLASPAFAEVLKWNCDLDTRVDSEGVAKEKMLLRFTVDTVSQKAFMEGNAGFVEVDIYVGETAFSFMEKAGSGAVQTTTVTKDGLVVHSRNTVILGEFVAAQHFGFCVPK